MGALASKNREEGEVDDSNDIDDDPFDCTCLLLLLILLMLIGYSDKGSIGLSDPLESSESDSIRLMRLLLICSSSSVQ